MLIARLIAEPAPLQNRLERAMRALAERGMVIDEIATVPGIPEVTQLRVSGGSPGVLRAVLDQHLAPGKLLVSDHWPKVPQVFVSDMDSTMIGQECIDELADFAGIKPQIAAITERAMLGELDFESALRQRVKLLGGLPEAAIAECLADRISAMPGAKVLVETLKAKGCRTVLVTGGFHQFADPVAKALGFERVVANRLEVADGKLTGGLAGPITDSSVKRAVLLEEAILAGEGSASLAMGDGANDIPMIEAATYGIAYAAKPKARAAADGWIDRGELTAALMLLGIPPGDWVEA